MFNHLVRILKSQSFPYTYKRDILGIGYNKFCVLTENKQTYTQLSLQ